MMAGLRPLPRARRIAGVHPRIILLAVLTAIVVACGLYLAAPWILPVRVYEGPMVQLASPDAVTLEWFTTRPAESAVYVSGGGVEQRIAAAADGTRNVARVSGLSPGVSYTYEIHAGRRALTSGLVFQTVRPPTEPYNFIVFGDSGMGNRVQFLLADDMASAQPPADFVLHTGDLVYNRGERRLYEERLFAPYRRLLARVNFWPCLGNHDVDADDRAPAYEAVYELPANGPVGLPAGHNYWFDYSTSRIAVLDTNADEVTLHDRVAPWLSEVMADPSRRWRFVAFHHPPYTGGKYMPDERLQRALVPALDAAGVDVVFNGHDHNYQRTYPLRDGRVVGPGEGVVYVVTGAGGAQLYPARQPRPAFIAALNDQHFSFTQVTVDGDELRLRQVALGGEVLDETSWQKSALVPATGPVAAEPVAAEE
jgi:3',5'-cyclic AMP phosphodiesterase CpdA